MMFLSFLFLSGRPMLTGALVSVCGIVLATFRRRRQPSSTPPGQKPAR